MHVNTLVLLTQPYFLNLLALSILFLQLVRRTSQPFSYWVERHGAAYAAQSKLTVYIHPKDVKDRKLKV